MERLKNSKSGDSGTSQRSVADSSVVRTSASIAAFAAAAIGMGGKALAEHYAFGPEINERRWGGVVGNAVAGGSQLVPGISDNRFKMLFGALNMDNGGGDTLAKEFEIQDVPDSGIVLRGLGPAVTVMDTYAPGEGDLRSYLEIPRADGRSAHRFLAPGQNDWDMEMDGQQRWESDPTEDSWCGDIAGEIIPTFDFKAIKIPAMLAEFGGWERQDIYRGNMEGDGSNLCVTISAAIVAAREAGQDPWQAGLLIRGESSPQWFEWRAPESRELLAVTRLTDPGTVTYMHRVDRDPETQTITNVQHLRRTAESVWVLENQQRPRSDPSVEDVETMLDRRTPAGREVTFVVYQEERQDTREEILKVFALEKQPDGSFPELPITFEESAEQADDDLDGVPNPDDNCVGRANPDQVDTDGNQVGDACEIDCAEGGWVGAEEPKAMNASGLRICRSERGYAHANSFEDGSSIESNAEVVLDGQGRVALAAGQEVFYNHSCDPRTECSENGAGMTIADGNSFSLEVYSATKLDGTPGAITVTYHPEDDPFGEPVVFRMEEPGNWDFGVGYGIELGVEGCSFKFRAGNENRRLPEADAGGLPPQPDAGDAQDAGQPVVDAGGADVGQPQPEAGQQDAGDADPVIIPPVDAGCAECAPEDVGEPPQPDVGSPPPQDAGTLPPPDAGTPPPTDTGHPCNDAGTPPVPDTGPPPVADTGTADTGQQPDPCIGLPVESCVEVADSGPETGPDAQPDAVPVRPDAGPEPDVPAQPDVETAEAGAPDAGADADTASVIPDTDPESPDAGDANPIDSRLRGNDTEGADEIASPDARNDNVPAAGNDTDDSGCSCEIASLNNTEAPKNPLFILASAIAAACASIRRRARDVFRK